MGATDTDGHDTPEQGLDSLTARQRLESEGRNELSPARRRSLLSHVGAALREPMLALLVAASLLYLVLGHLSDAALLAVSTVVMVSITVAQARRTDRALDALRELAAPRARVVRDGVERLLDAVELVRGDLVAVQEGERVPADCEIVDTLHLEVDESLLTGEALPVAKRATALAGDPDASRVFAGTLVTTGHALAVVRSTGARTALGTLGSSLTESDPVASPLQREVKRLVRWLALGATAACVVVVVVYALSRGGTLGAWGDGLLAGIALAMSALPEELPVVLTVFSALGAWRLARVNVLTRRATVIETLGLTDVLCVDKTGTLTCNHMVLERISCGTDHDVHDTSNDDARVIALLALAERACRVDEHDPMDRAVHEAAQRHAAIRSGAGGATLLRELPWTPDVPMISNVWSGAGGQSLVASKGAPEAILARCDLAPELRRQLDAHVARLGTRGWRVLAVGSATMSAAQIPATNHALQLELAGFLAFSDPVRADVADAVRRCTNAGVRVVMITGDAPATAAHVAQQAGLPSGATLTGDRIATANDAELARLVETSTVFARVRPEQKVRIVQALQANGHVVGMTGDGVNDAPALRAAHVGIAMGKRGSDVAREAADLILLDDRFGSLVDGIATGRRIDENLRKAARFIVGVHIPVLGLSLLPAFSASWPLLLLPAHIAFLELVIDPACSILFESEPASADAMERPPRARDERLFSRAVVKPAIVQGVAILAVCLLVLQIARLRLSEGAVRAVVFVTLVGAVFALMQATRAPTARGRGAVSSVPFLLLLIAAAALLAAALLTRTGRSLFHFDPLPLGAIGLALLTGLVSLSWLGDRRT